MADKKYVTRGALMQCSNGTHCRRLNLTQGHGFEMSIEGRTDDSGTAMSEAGKRHPFVLDTDIVVALPGMGADVQQNISWFGVCREATYQGENVVLKPDTSLGEPKSHDNVTGTKCIPLITQSWEQVKDRVVIKGASGEEGHLLTTDSFLVCDQCGGCITFVDVDGEVSDGTDYWDEQDK